MVKIPIKGVVLFILLVDLNVISQTINNDFPFLFKKHSDSLMVRNNNIFWNTTKTNFQNNTTTLTLFEKKLLFPKKKRTNPLDIEKTKDTVNKKLLKAKMEAERWKCTQLDPKMIAAKKAEEEKFKKMKL